MNPETICLGLPLVLIVTAGWAALISYADYVVAQFDRYGGYKGRQYTTIGNLLQLPWHSPTQLVISSMIFGVLALVLALLHWVALLLIAVAVFSVVGVTLFSDVQKLNGLVDRIPSRPAPLVYKPSAVPVSSMLIGRRGEYKGVEIECAPNMKIGRGQNNRINLREKAVSRKHARIRFSQGLWFIQDEDSTTGTFLNGQRIRANRLNHGDVITIGGSEFEFREG